MIPAPVAAARNTSSATASWPDLKNGGFPAVFSYIFFFLKATWHKPGSAAPLFCAARIQFSTRLCVRGLRFALQAGFLACTQLPIAPPQPVWPMFLRCMRWTVSACWLSCLPSHTITVCATYCWLPVVRMGKKKPTGLVGLNLFSRRRNRGDRQYDACEWDINPIYLYDVSYLQIA